MPEIISTMRRSAIMRSVRQKNTGPEMVVRRIAHAIGARYRLHRKDLPGRPDLVFPRRRLCIFVHGCFWHRHPGCRLASIPGSNVEFWHDKFTRNVERDARKENELRAEGWRVEIIWECETRDPRSLEERLRALLFP
ncbi:very short patch repair endonuclease [Marilutibacter chinensis]|uniref:Very short patch repair endonuclease n=1 Tax=Marilutibacter chinensis TaxID=2912247 RepID=A0ABS9HVN5_9GAMM|nr:DNA mismatch endonuclease Vsr [Lysobacter chinensis]MCF7222212.1 DNA mismatch endonuclease Vsr [Lysobacter chinensis]